MSLGNALHQKSGQPGRTAGGDGEAVVTLGRGEANLAGHGQEGSGRDGLLRQALSRENMVTAWKRVKANKGSAGVDGLSIEQTHAYLKTYWPHIRSALLRGTYRPQAVRRVAIPKPAGGTRELGIATVTDRLIQQAVLQILQPLIDPTFSEYSYRLECLTAVIFRGLHFSGGHVNDGSLRIAIQPVCRGGNHEQGYYVPVTR